MTNQTTTDPTQPRPCPHGCDGHRPPANRAERRGNATHPKRSELIGKHGGRSR